MSQFPKYLVLARHYKCVTRKDGGSTDTPVDGAFPALYDSAGKTLSDLVQKFSLLPEEVEVRHTSKKRTKDTGRVLLCQAFMKENDFPLNLDGLDKTQRPCVLNATFTLDPRLDYLDPDGVNLKVYAKQGAAGCIDFVLQNKEATEHEGQPIEPFFSVYNRAVAALNASLVTLLSTEMRLIIMVSHATMIEYPAIHLLQSGRDDRIGSVAEIGGPFATGEIGILRLDKETNGIGARFQYKGTTSIPVRLNRL